MFLGRDGNFWDFWLIVSLAIGAIPAIAVALTTTGSLISHKREAAAADRSLTEYKIKTAGELGEARATSDVAKSDAARANENAANANERAATLEKEAAKLRAAAAWRSITLDQYNSLKASLAGQNFEVWTSWVGNDPEATQYRFAIDKALTDAGLKTKYFSGWERAVGLQITDVPGPDHDALVAAFEAAKIPFFSVPPTQGQTKIGQELTIIVGTKPPPF